jgi:hypothetical protein
VDTQTERTELHVARAETGALLMARGGDLQPGQLVYAYRSAVEGDNSWHVVMDLRGVSTPMGSFTGDMALTDANRTVYIMAELLTASKLYREE